MDRNPVEGYMDNGIAAIFTMMLPGLGQMLKNEVIKGIIWAVLVGGGYLVNGWLGLSLHLLCILDAAFTGGIKNYLKSMTLPKKVIVFISFSALIIYTCLRTALF